MKRRNVLYVLTVLFALCLLCFVGCNVDTRQTELKSDLGITVSGLDSKAVYDAAKQKSVVKENVTVKSVAAGTAAETAGFKEGDVITKVKLGRKEYETDRMYKLIDLVLLQHVGDEVEYTVLRGGETVTITWTVTAGQMTKIS